MSANTKLVLLIGFTLVGGAVGFYIEDKVVASYKVRAATVAPTPTRHQGVKMHKRALGTGRRGHENHFLQCFNVVLVRARARLWLPFP